jgi:hypothetical protein
MAKSINSLKAIVICQQWWLAERLFFFQKFSVCYTWNADKTFLFACLSAFHRLQTAHLRLSFLRKGEMGRTARTFVISLFRANHSCASRDSYFLCMLCSSVVAGLVVNCGTLPQTLSVLKLVPNDCMGRDSSVGTVNRYDGLDGPVRTFSYTSSLSLGPPLL